MKKENARAWNNRGRKYIKGQREARRKMKEELSVETRDTDVVVVGTNISEIPFRRLCIGGCGSGVRAVV